KIHELIEFIASASLKTTEAATDEAQDELNRLTSSRHAFLKQEEPEKTVHTYPLTVPGAQLVAGNDNGENGDSNNDPSPAVSPAAQAETNADETLENFSSLLPESLNRYRLVRLLGRGACGTVFEAKQGNTTYAIKFVELPARKLDQEQAHREVDCLRRCNSFALTKLFESHVDQNWIIMVLQYSSAGDLLTEIENRNCKLSPFLESEANMLFLQLIFAIKHLHDRNIMHHDIKSSNVLLDINGLIRLGDFGFCEHYDRSISENVASTSRGTYSYAAPEVQNSNSYHRYSKKADLFSLGVVFYEILALRIPFVTEDTQERIAKIAREHYMPLSENITPDLRLVVRRLLSRDPNLRPDADEILAMPYFQSVASYFLERTAGFPEHEVIKNEILGNIRSRLMVHPNFFGSYESVASKKRSNGNWVEFYLRLSSADENGQRQLSIYKNNFFTKSLISTKPLSVFVTVFEMPQLYCSCKHYCAFAIMTENGGKAIFRTETKKDRDRWVAGLRSAFSAQAQRTESLLYLQSQTTDPHILHPESEPYSPCEELNSTPLNPVPGSQKIKSKDCCSVM
ncbi:MAG: protein kinase, partial [Myxococcaceae bacterium]